MFPMLTLATVLSLGAPGSQAGGFTRGALPAGCGLPQDGNTIADPPELRSHGGFLRVTLFLRGNDPQNPSQGQAMCYVYRQGGRLAIVPPTLRVKQGDRIDLTLVNDLSRPHSAALAPPDSGGVGLMCGQPQLAPTPSPNPHTGRIYGYHRTPWNETSMHFHGLNTSPKQPGDNVTQVMICPRKGLSDPPNSYAYAVDIPRDEPPGFYWYHPHAHGESEYQVQLGLTGAIIVDPLAPSRSTRCPIESWSCATRT
ncbi:MAG: multicopper oxidase domain-containing protein [Candidatus Baltobacteraceae bacterium]